MTSHGAAKRLHGIKDRIWYEFTQICQDYKAIDLGLGFPDCGAPENVTKALSIATLSGNNQYTRGHGHPRLVRALAQLYSKLLGRKIDAENEIVITIGAHGALYCCIFGLVNPGDEVIIVEPFFSCYRPMTCIAGGIPVFIPLRPTKSGVALNSKDWILDPQELSSKFNEKTKMIIINNPHNPMGKVFTKEELSMIADLCIKYDVIAVMDEVYEWLVYKGQKHIRMATLPGMWDRTITIGSAGKTFSVTGWKLGWVYGPQHLISSLQQLHANSIAVCPTPIQEAVAVSFETEIEKLDKPTSYWCELAESLEIKRDKIAKVLSDVRMYPTVPDAGYFIIADISEIDSKVDTTSEEGSRAYRFAKWLIKTKRLMGIPPSAFYSDEHKNLGDKLIRFCFFKDDSTLDKASAILQELKSISPQQSC